MPTRAAPSAGSAALPVPLRAGTDRSRPARERVPSGQRRSGPERRARRSSLLCSLDPPRRRPGASGQCLRTGRAARTYRPAGAQKTKAGSFLRALPAACPSKRPLGRPGGPDRLRWVRNAQRADCAGGSSFREAARGPTERTLRPAACRLPCPRAHPRSADSPPKERCFGLLNGFPATRNDESHVPLRYPGRSGVAGTAPRTRWPKRRRNSIRLPSWTSAFRSTAQAPPYWRPAPVPLAPRNLGPVCGAALPAGTHRTSQVGSGLAAAPSVIRA